MHKKGTIMHKLTDRIKYVTETKRTIIGETGTKGNRIKWCFPKSKYFVVHRGEHNSLLIKKATGLPKIEFDKQNRLRRA